MHASKVGLWHNLKFSWATLWYSIALVWVLSLRSSTTGIFYGCWWEQKYHFFTSPHPTRTDFYIHFWLFLSCCSVYNIKTGHSTQFYTLVFQLEQVCLMSIVAHKIENVLGRISHDCHFEWSKYKEWSVTPLKIEITFQTAWSNLKEQLFFFAFRSY